MSENNSIDFLINRIRNFMNYGQSRDQIHKALVGEQDVSEEDFFLAYKSAEMMMENAND